MGIIANYVALAKMGTMESITILIDKLHKDMTLKESRFVDFALGQIDTEHGHKIMEYYIMNGTQIQRNYCALYFGRLGDYDIIQKAYDAGKIDATQAWAR